MLITIASLHHHHNPLFSKKSGQKQASGTSLPCLLDPLFSISVGGSRFQKVLVNLSSWNQKNQQNIVAHTLSISTNKMLAPDLSNAQKVEVLTLNLHTDKFILPE
ncbi:putative disease resistance protein [Trifolium repens]|nr:putative disease resistance protein [Trifolium repens]